MFNFSDKTQANITFKMLELFRTLKVDKQVKSDAQVIAEVKLANILSPDRTFMESSEQVKEIYIIDITLSSRNVPMLFIDVFNRYIEFQTLFKLIYKDEVKYISSVKYFTEEKMKVLKTFESDWQKEEQKELPITNKLENVFKQIINNITSTSFRQDESFDSYITRLDSIKKLKVEIEKQTKTMNNEKQPNLRMALNDKIKQMKKELAVLDGDITSQSTAVKTQTIKQCTHPSVYTKQNNWGYWDVCSVCGQRIEDSFHYFNHYDGEDHDE